MEHMELDQPTTIQNEEQKKSKLLHARDGEDDDDTSYPSDKKKCGKQDIDLPKEKPAVKDFQINKLIDFKIYNSVPAQVYEDLIIHFEGEIQSCERALNEASKFFKIKFEEDLEQKQPSPASSYVIEAVQNVQNNVRSDLDRAYKLLPTVKKYVENFLEYRDGPLLALRDAENQYFKKIDEFIEIPNVEKLIKCLVYNVNDYKEIELRSGLTQSDMYVIIFSLGRKDTYIPYEKDNTMDEEQYGESEMEDLLIKHKDNIKEICSLRNSCQTAKDEVNEYVWDESEEVNFCLWQMEGYLMSADSWLWTMRKQLEVLLQKDVILHGCESNFDEDWIEACQGRICVAKCDSS